LFSRDHRPTEADWQQEEPVDKAKPFDIPKREVWEAFKKVKANQGAAGVDGQTIADFEADLSNNLYELWNRLSSGSYFPPPVRRVDIPKMDGGTRPLGIPTVADRVAQEVVRRYLKPCLEPEFHPGSYGYRPGKSAIDAVRQARQRCWRYDWVLDIDVKAYFDSIDWELMLRAVRHHTSCPWVLLYIERWLRAPVRLEDGSVAVKGEVAGDCGGVRAHGTCKSAEEAQALWSALADRFAACKLVLHPEKTRIVYCKDANRRGDFPNQSFDFLGFSFRARETMWQGVLPAHGFMPASPKALTAISRPALSWHNAFPQSASRPHRLHGWGVSNNPLRARRDSDQAPGWTSEMTGEIRQWSSSRTSTVSPAWWKRPRAAAERASIDQSTGSCIPTCIRPFE
jgi:RNA-directed DNA polymerase